MKKQNKGITLIALVITIIVLLILAGVSIITLTGENGILKQVAKAQKEQDIARAREEIQLALHALEIDERSRTSKNPLEKARAEIVVENLIKSYPEQETESIVWDYDINGFEIRHRAHWFYIENDYSIRYDRTEDSNNGDGGESDELVVFAADGFLWLSDDENAGDDYNTIVGFAEDIMDYLVETENGMKLVIPNRCKILEHSYYGEGSYSIEEYITSIEIPDTVEVIGSYTFDGFKNLTSIEIPDSVTTIRDGAFRYCDNLASVKLPNNITKIQWELFSGCFSLTNITIPASVTEIEMDAFADCEALAEITILSNEIDIHEDVFDVTAWYNNHQDGGLYLGSVLYEYKGTIQENDTVTIAEGTKVINRGAFRGQSELTTIVLPEGLTSIGESAFEGCTKLANITLPDSLTKIGKNAFKNCSSLTSIDIPDDVVGIEKSTFEGCTNLTNVSISKNLKYIESNAFKGCTKLENIIIWKNVEEVRSGAFRGWIDTQTINIEEDSVPEKWSPSWNEECNAKVVFAYTDNNN